MRRDSQASPSYRVRVSVGEGGREGGRRA